MKIQSPTQHLCLAQNHSLSLSDALGARVRCQAGGLWITQDHDLRDIVLAPGESFTLDRDGPVIVSALVGSSVEVRAPQPRGHACRVH